MPILRRIANPALEQPKFMPPATDPGARPRVVIVGGGFGGLYAARRMRNLPVNLVLVDRRNHHLFQPLLYQVATAELNPSDIAAPIRHILRRQLNTEVLLERVMAVDAANNRIILRDGDLSYDFLILATGATHSYFGHNEWVNVAPGLKSIEDALQIRSRVLLAFEKAEHEADPSRRQTWLTFVIVGAGPTGVELAGALAEISRLTLTGDFRRINPASARVVLLEGTDRVLPTYTRELSEAAKRQLAQLGVEVHTGAMVTNIDSEGVTVGTKHLAARTVLWAAGVQASPLAKSLRVPLDRAGRVLVDPDLRVPGLSNVYVVGDLAAVREDGAYVPGVAPAAIQEGVHAANNLARQIRGQAPVPFRYRDKGSLATIGRAAAVAHLGRLNLTGWIAWMAWLFVHIFFLIGFRNRLLVIFEWAWSYFTAQRGARLITGAPPPSAPDRDS
jgi:NADH:ubiquinone reductase (H+-translocating)